VPEGKGSLRGFKSADDGENNVHGVNHGSADSGGGGYEGGLSMMSSTKYCQRQHFPTADTDYQSVREVRKEELRPLKRVNRPILA
jgi:hypothetical protein